MTDLPRFSRPRTALVSIASLRRLNVLVLFNLMVSLATLTLVFVWGPQ